MRGVLVTLEGIDGTGKSTVARILSEWLKCRDVLLTAEPTHGYAGKILRDRFLTAPPGDIAVESRSHHFQELFLFMADHADHLERTVSPALEMGKLVISDRYADSTAAYQGATLMGLIPESDPVMWIKNLYGPWNIVPDRTLLFILDPDEALERIRSRDSALAKFEREDFLSRVAENFRRLARLEPERFALVDASRDAADVAEESLEIIQEILLAADSSSSGASSA